jgi:tRNA1(Val) A37 N6-methylase TrmN6
VGASRVAADDFPPAVLGPMVDLLAELADGGPVVEFGVGTGRVALPLAARGLAVQRIELSPEMAEQLRDRLAHRERWGGWRREPFTADSTSQVAVFERTPLT